jgi:ABC-2 type transport system ATP-binding protein
MISCENLTCFYGSFLAVDRLTLEIPRGSVCALVGPNGAGKTTTMRMLCTLLRPSHGKATIGGFDVVREPTQVRRLIGYLPEEFRLYEDMTVERYLEFFGRVYSLDAAMRHERSTDFLERLGLKDRRKDRVGELSRGMKQRVGVAKSFLHDPEVVFLDEPASGLDPVARTELRDFLKHQQWLGKTVVVSSHVLKELADFCDYLVMIHRGKLSESGSLTGENGVLARHSETATGGKPYTLKVLRDAPKLEMVLQKDGGVTNIRRRDQIVSFDLAGDEEAAGRLLAQLTAVGFPIVRFEPEEIDLEGVYRKVSGAEAKR